MKSSIKILSIVALSLLAVLAITSLPQKASAYVAGDPSIPVPSPDGSYANQYRPTTYIGTNGYTLGTSDQLIVLPATNVTVTLPAAVNGREYLFVNTAPHGTNSLAHGVTGQNINGQTTWQLTNQYSGMRIRCDGTNWFIVSSSGAAYVP